MPKNIKDEDIQRMFPFEFYDDLNTHFKEYVLYQTAFMTSRIKDISLNERKEIFQSFKNDESIKALRKDNILELQPYGEVLILDVCMEHKYIDKYFKDIENRSQIPISMLAVQLYDSSDSPVFSKEVTQETIERIPEVLIDDPNLLLAIINIGQQGENSMIGTISVPLAIQKIYFEDID